MKQEKRRVVRTRINNAAAYLSLFVHPASWIENSGDTSEHSALRVVQMPFFCLLLSRDKDRATPPAFYSDLPKIKGPTFNFLWRKWWCKDYTWNIVGNEVQDSSRSHFCSWLRLFFFSSKSRVGKGGASQYNISCPRYVLQAIARLRAFLLRLEAYWTLFVWKEKAYCWTSREFDTFSWCQLAPKRAAISVSTRGLRSFCSVLRERQEKAQQVYWLVLIRLCFLSLHPLT